MKDKRNMFYSNNQAGAFIDPQMIPPQGYIQNSQYQAFGPNAVPQNYQYGYTENDLEARITKLERQIRNLDTRLQKLETNTITEDTIIDNNSYMI